MLRPLGCYDGKERGSEVREGTHELNDYEPRMSHLRFGGSNVATIGVVHERERGSEMREGYRFNLFF